MLPSDKPTPEDLATALHDEIQVCRQLVDLTRRERDGLLSGDLTAVAATVRDKGEMMRSLAEIEANRSRLTATLAVAMGLPSDVGMQGLIGHLDAPDAQTMQSMRQECIALVSELQLLNQGNTGLIQTRLDRIEATLGFLARIGHEGDAPYTPCGITSSPASTGHVLNWQI